MPYGGTPPTIRLSQSVFSSLAAMTYDATNGCFWDGQNQACWLFVEKQQQSDAGQWFYGTNAEGGTSPRGVASRLVGTLIANGQYDAQTESIAYGQSYYKLRLERDGNGSTVATAFVV